ncbi:MAG: hypothetical protein A2161_17980 [Candidatus Schekmanbacteria bacterium RBG_13_48_7]|uniref:Uncharacterized protein n=1 Tax=Candidatus Schekmanbacteria bacterium RBG_13_48_7 TaxID=1817878 RepID=A0A1F7RIB7_9BACT|nr:MAG: hypothetical protein A2161_17980 [Candidatus Schekmanbacteria bacterium RBG_13_48_7]
MLKGFLIILLVIVVLIIAFIVGIIILGTYFNPFQLAFLINFDIVNTNDIDIWITPIGRTEGGRYYSPLPGKGFKKHYNKLLPANGSISIEYDWDDIAFAYILIKTSDESYYVMETDIGLYISEDGKSFGCCNYREKSRYLIPPLSELMECPEYFILCTRGKAIEYDSIEDHMPIKPRPEWQRGFKTVPESNRLEKDHAPTPYSSEEIREGCPPGRTMLFRCTVPEKPDYFKVMAFENCDIERACFQEYSLDSGGNLIGEKQNSQLNWTDLQQHASFSKTETMLSMVAIETELGYFQCWHYTVQTESGGKKKETHYYFSKTNPGPPVLLIEKVENKTILKMTMIVNSRYLIISFPLKHFQHKPAKMYSMDDSGNPKSNKIDADF